MPGGATAARLKTFAFQWRRRTAPDIQGASMPLFLDIHDVGDGVTMEDVAKAHQADLATQGEYGVDYLRYWVDEAEGKIFCLVEAPSPEVAAEVHRKAHGLVADEIFQVQEGV